MVFPIKVPGDRFELGSQCLRGHTWPGSGLNLRVVHPTSSTCVQCRRLRQDRPWWLQFADWRDCPVPDGRKLGKLCPKGHEWRGTGLSLRLLGALGGKCVECEATRQATENRKDRNRRYQERNREAIRDRDRKRRHLPHRRAAQKEANRRRHALARAGRHLALSPATAVSVRERVQLWGCRCAYCSVPLLKTAPLGHPLRLTVDHVLPLANGGLDEMMNIVPACWQCNTSKGCSPMEEWFRKQSFFTEAALAKVKRHAPSATGQLSIWAAA
jgi:hypothetical protein